MKAILAGVIIVVCGLARMDYASAGEGNLLGGKPVVQVCDPPDPTDPPGGE